MGAFIGVETLEDGFWGLDRAGGGAGDKEEKINRSMWEKLRIIGNTWLQEIKTRKDPI